MDEAQLQTLLTYLQQQQQTMLSTLLSQLKTSTPAQESIQISNITPFEHFNPNQEKFSNYVERFDNYCRMKNITSEEKKAPQLLCVSIGSMHYNNLGALLGPAKPVNQLSYTDLLSSLKQMLSPKRSTVVSQHYFLNIYQKEDQNISEFVASLQRDIADCNFNVKCSCNQAVSISDTFLRAQFVRGLKDNWIREQILQSSATTFDEILTKATALEASRIESQELTGTCSSSSNFNSTEVYRTSPSHSVSSCQRSRSHQKQRKSFHSQSNNQNIDFKAFGIDNHCLRCGLQNHKSTECSVDKNSLKCNLCKKTGHVSTVCLSSLMQDKKNSNSTYSMETCQLNSSLPSYGMYQIEPVLLNENSEIIDLFEFNNESDKYMIYVLLNGKQQKFEVDSGAKYSLLSEREFEKLNLNTPLIESNLAFRSYTGNVINSKGKLLIQVQYKDQTMMGELHIVPDRYNSLLGRQWIRGLNIQLSQIEPHVENRCTTSPLLQMQSADEVSQGFPKVSDERLTSVHALHEGERIHTNIKHHSAQSRSSVVHKQKTFDFQVPSVSRLPPTTNNTIRPQLRTFHSRSPVRLSPLQSPVRPQIQTPVRPEVRTPGRSPTSPVTPPTIVRPSRPVRTRRPPELYGNPVLYNLT
uniref:CCHC-type domain-containing protein n=1 Tax=Cacopsylla melanoneura TaxID=428564 RepID=A0A8D8Q661_9HEMI